MYIRLGCIVYASRLTHCQSLGRAFAIWAHSNGTSPYGYAIQYYIQIQRVGPKGMGHGIAWRTAHMLTVRSRRSGYDSRQLYCTPRRAACLGCRMTAAHEACALCALWTCGVQR